MITKELKIKISILIVFLAVVSIIAIFWFYKTQKKTEGNIIKAEIKFTESGFDKFYQKENNEFCVKGKSAQEQEDISKDMLWILETQEENYQKLETIECEDGETGVKVR